MLQVTWLDSWQISAHVISCLLGSCQAVPHVLPVNHLPDVLQIFGPQVVVLLVVGMLPDVNAQHRCQPLHIQAPYCQRQTYRLSQTLTRTFLSAHA